MAIDWRWRTGLARLKQQARRLCLGHSNLRLVRQVVVAVVGGLVLLIGVALIVLPGPAVLVIPAGLAILGLEFAWARRWLQKGRQLVRERFGFRCLRRPNRP